MKKMISEFGDVAKQWNERMQPMMLMAQKAAEAAAIKCGMLESDFDEFMSQYKQYFLKNGFITPKHFEEFFSWLCGCRWAESDEPFGAIEIKESDFTLYHEYKELKLNPYGWNDHQERERLEVMFNNSGIDFNGLSKFLKDKGLTEVKADVLQTMHENEQLPLNLKTKPKWKGKGADAKVFRSLMWPNANRGVFNKCFAFGKNGLEKNHENSRSINRSTMTSFFPK